MGPTPRSLARGLGTPLRRKMELFARCARVLALTIAIVLIAVWQLLAWWRARPAVDGYARISPAEEHVSPPCSPADEEAAKRQRLDLRPFLDERRFWNDDVNVAIMRASAKSKLAFHRSRVLVKVQS